MVDPRYSKSAMYSHLSADRRDMPLPENPNATPFQTHQSIGQALGPTHGHMNGQSTYNRQPQSAADNYHRISQSQSPPTNTTATQQHGSPLTFVNAPGPSSAAKRKQPQQQPESLLNGHVSKRRREVEETTATTTTESYDDSSGAGAKHWTDDEKTLLFQWLMGPTHDDHWNALRATKNSCLRECSVEVFGNKKTYQALKGCYERNFNLFKQIYAFETFHQQAGTGPVSAQGEADRIREYERRLAIARRGGCDVGNISARVIDHWHRIGWYDLFYRRWHGDPVAVMRIPAQGRGPTNGMGDDADIEDDQQTLDYSDSPQASHPMNTHPPPPMPQHQHQLHQHPHPQTLPSYISPHQTLRDPPPPVITRHPSPPPAPPVQTPVPPPVVPLAVSGSGSDQSIVNVPLTQGMITAYLQFLQMQTQTGKQKLEYMRRREEREEKESAYRRETERLRTEREKAEFEHNKQSANIKARADRAIEVLGSPVLDASLKQAAGDYLKKLFSDS
ncbi:hypothetical protein C8F01DRAFT_354086 [Mycena amicta]|nr:hypothetical protein C8F01DRAFT_354086 [Mycena amicta]